MSYNTALLKLYQLGQQGVKLGLDNMRKMSDLFGKPETKYRTIHIAGSNGKGSVSLKIAHSYQLSGKKVGLYTSPHISTFRERIQVDGKMISEETAARLLEELFSRTENIPATFFELTTLLAFLYFAEQNVDVAIIEAGLGGRLDATNIIIPELAVITSISLDHTEILGCSIEVIAAEKRGIVKPPVPVLIGPHVPLEVIQRAGAPTFQVIGEFGSFDEENSAIAQKALELLQVPPLGLQIRPPCRMEEIMGREAPLVLDVAHNPDGLRFLFQSMNQKWNVPFQVVCGLSASKDLASCAQILAKEALFIHLVAAKHERAAPTERIAHELDAMHFSKYSIYPSVADGLAAALDLGLPTLVCGSFFLMPEVRIFLNLPYPADFLSLNEKIVAHYPHIR